MDATIATIGGILTAIVGGIAGILVTWAKYRKSMIEVQKATKDIQKNAVLVSAQMKHDAHAQVVQSFKSLLEVAGNQLAEQRGDLMSQLMSQRQDFAATLKEDREYHRHSLNEITLGMKAISDRAEATNDQLTKLAEHALANREFSKFLHDWIIRESSKAHHGEGG